jgi:SAM-dependent methyltransferase
MPGPRSNWATPNASKDYQVTRPNYDAETFRKIFSLAPITSSCVALDIACGTGQVLRWLLNEFSTVAGVDLSNTQIEEARAVTVVPEGRRLFFIQGAAESFTIPEDVPIREGQVDLCTCASALHWLNHAAFGDRISRVLKPGGHLCCWTPMPSLYEPAVVGDILKKYHSQMSSMGFRQHNLRDPYYADEILKVSQPRRLEYVQAIEHKVTHVVPGIWFVRIAATYSTYIRYTAARAAALSRSPRPDHISETEWSSGAEAGYPRFQHEASRAGL